MSENKYFQDKGAVWRNNKNGWESLNNNKLVRILNKQDRRIKELELKTKTHTDRLREQFEQLVRTGSVTTLNGKIVDIYSDENKKPLADE